MKPNSEVETTRPSLDDLVTEKYLLEKFEVSSRTIRRWCEKGRIQRIYFDFLDKPMYDKREIEGMAVKERVSKRQNEFIKREEGVK